MGVKKTVAFVSTVNEIIARNTARELFQSDLRFITYANQLFFILQSCQ